jgi:inosine-uridine nucleoside N-ribohydrolase
MGLFRNLIFRGAVWAGVLVVCWLFCTEGSASGGIAALEKDRTIPIMYCTDIYHPPADPDDHFDLASMYAIDEFDIKAVILDNAASKYNQGSKNGVVAVGQMNHITGRTIPCAIGLLEKLKSPDDSGFGQPDEFQGGVRKIIEILESTNLPVKIIAVGSLRDVAAAFNRRPDLFHDKVDVLVVFAGDASAKTEEFMEYNVELDVHAFVRIMNAQLPVY